MLLSASMATVKQRGVSRVEATVMVSVALLGLVGFGTYERGMSKKVRCFAERVATFNGSSGSCAAGSAATAPVAAHAPAAPTQPSPPVMCGRDGCDLPACFEARTPVLTPHGQREIATLREGDYVLARDPHTGEEAPKRVLSVMRTPNKSIVRVRVTTGDGQDAEIGTTFEHPFWVERVGFMDAGMLEPGDFLGNRPGSAPVRVQSLTQEDVVPTVYNLEVEDFHTYFVGRAPVLVHNQYSLTVDLARDWSLDEVRHMVLEYSTRQTLPCDCRVPFRNYDDAMRRELLGAQPPSPPPLLGGPGGNASRGGYGPYGGGIGSGGSAPTPFMPPTPAGAPLIDTRNHARFQHYMHLAMSSRNAEVRRAAFAGLCVAAVDPRGGSPEARQRLRALAAASPDPSLRDIAERTFDPPPPVVLPVSSTDPRPEAVLRPPVSPSRHAREGTPGCTGYICSRATRVGPVGDAVMSAIGGQHQWVMVKCGGETFESGLGPRGGGVPGQEGGNNGGLFDPTSFNDHAGQHAERGSVCQGLNGCDAKCLREETRHGRPMPRFMTPADGAINQCNQAAYDALFRRCGCANECIRWRELPTRNVTMHSGGAQPAERVCVEYAYSGYAL